jgi:hypothetical protein
MGYSMRAMRLLTMTIAAAALAAPAFADETGLAGMHDWRKEGKKTCFVDHTHFGTSAGLATKAQAQAEAIQSWSSFTSLEYGSSWANFSKASSKKIDCKQSGSGTWGCDLSARPCR